MRDFRTQLARLPAPLFFLVTAILFGGGTWLVHWVLNDHLGRGGEGLAFAVIQGIAFGAVLTVVLVRQRRRLGGAASAFAFGDALRGKPIPAEVDTSAWPARLTDLETQARRMRVLGLILFALLVALSIYLIFDDPHGRLIGIVGLVLFAGAGVFYAVYPRLLHRRVSALRARLMEPDQDGTNQALH